MGAEFSLDMEHVFFGKAKEHSRYTLALSAVHDWGRAGGRAPSVTLAHADATAVVVRPDYEVHLVAGCGGRPGAGGAWGAVAGAGLDAGTETLNLRLRLEVRHQRGGFRQGFFGADYELARFQAAGPDGVPLADAGFPDGYSAFGEAEVGWDAVSYGGLYRHLKLSLGAEAFSWGLFDVDGSVAVQLFERSLEVALKGMGVGMGQPGARYLGAAEVRWRFLGGKLYAMGTGGTLLFPTAEGTLRPGAFASVGLGGTMRANALLVVVAVLAMGAASVAHASGLGGALRYAPRVATSPAWVEPPIDEAPRSSDTSPFSISEPGVDQRRARQRGPRHDATGAVPGTVSGAVGGWSAERRSGASGNPRRH